MNNVEKQQKCVDILHQHADIVRRLQDKRIIAIDHCGGKVTLTEACDDWYTIKLSKSDCFEISELFKELAEITDEEDDV